MTLGVIQFYVGKLQSRLIGPLAVIALLVISCLGFVSCSGMETKGSRQAFDMFRHKEKSELKGENKLFEMWRKPLANPQLKVYFFNVTNPADFLRGEKPILKEIGPYVYDERREKVNITWNENGTVSYTPIRWYFFNRDLSFGDETDLVQQLNVPLIWGAEQFKLKNRHARWVYSEILKSWKQEAFTVRSVGELMWGYADDLTRFYVSPKKAQWPKSVVNELSGFFVGRNGSGTEGRFTVHAGRNSLKSYGLIDNWNGMTKLPYWRTDKCNSLAGSTDGTVFPPYLTKKTTLHTFDSRLCRRLPLVFQREVIHNGIPGYRFVPPRNVFGNAAENPDNECFCPMGKTGAQCDVQGLFNVTACHVFDDPIAISWPHFLYGDPKLLNAVEGLEPDSEKHSFYIDFQPKVSIATRVKARIQINLMLSKIEGIPQVAGIREMAFPLVWFESGFDRLPDKITQALKRFSRKPTRM